MAGREPFPRPTAHTAPPRPSDGFGDGDATRMHYPADLSWTSTLEIEVRLRAPDREAMALALDRLREDVYRLAPGIGGVLAALADAGGNEFDLGCNKRLGAPVGCVGFAPRAAVERAGPRGIPPRAFALGPWYGPGSADWSLDFFHSHYGCPSDVRGHFVLPYAAACDAVLAYLDGGGLTGALRWAEGLWPQDICRNGGDGPRAPLPPFG